MGRKTSRDLWTAKLMGNLSAGGNAGGSLPAGKVAGSPAGGRLAGEAARPAAAASLAIKTGAGKQAVLPAAAVLGALAGKGKQAARNASLRKNAEGALRVGHRLPFHGIVLGIDPSLRGTGLAVVRFSPPEQPRLLFSTTVRNRPSLTPTQCLGAIARAVSEAIETYNPGCVALEQTVYVQNVKTSLTLGSARGAAIAPAAMLGLEVFEYAPTRLKQAVVGSGRASKEQVAGMVKSLLQAGRDLLPSDEADAAAAAICHAFTVRS